MASTSAASMALPLAGATQNRMPSSEAFFKPLPVKPWRAMGGNFLLSIAAGGVVLVAIVGAVIGVSNFDPVKRT
ncbi:hypothetical protein Goarm_001355 [Gossypium armourianum]|uniref:Photosystem II reaction center X protein n=1 Tax=Gossypium armourianum TaxID=34283 RepID=A0A7J9KCS3_9ROSI|nr:hypothetical protein [Gossypium armourianum]